MWKLTDPNHTILSNYKKWILFENVHISFNPTLECLMTTTGIGYNQHMCFLSEKSSATCPPSVKFSEGVSNVKFLTWGSSDDIGNLWMSHDNWCCLWSSHMLPNRTASAAFSPWVTFSESVRNIRFLTRGYLCDVTNVWMSHDNCTVE